MISNKKKKGLLIQGDTKMTTSFFRPPDTAYPLIDFSIKQNEQLTNAKPNEKVFHFQAFMNH